MAFWHFLSVLGCLVCSIDLVSAENSEKYINFMQIGFKLTLDKNAFIVPLWNLFFSGYASFVPIMRKLEEYRHLGPARYFLFFLKKPKDIPVKRVSVKLCSAGRKKVSCHTQEVDGKINECETCVPANCDQMNNNHLQCDADVMVRK